MVPKTICSMACMQLIFTFFRYCFQVPNKEVDYVATELLRELVRFQDRQFHKDPVKVNFSTLMI